MFTIAHISDLHFSSGAFKKNPRHSHSIYQLKSLENHITNIEDMDFIVVSGDISNCGDSDSLCRAYDWLFKKYNIGQGEDIGLELNQAMVGIVPGNHDAWNSRTDSGNLKERRQKSLANYNNVFINHKLKKNEPYYYRWIQKNDHGIYIVFLDSCFLGEQRDENDNVLKLPYIDDIARGKLSIEQSEMLLEWHDKGINGSLEDPDNPGKFIDKNIFTKSLKILVMHHYLFEPPNRSTDYFMQINQRDIVFKNLALSDFDVLLCGHKHVASFNTHTYGQHFDGKATNRYLLNCFRRLIGIHSLPIQYIDNNGKKWARPFSMLINIIKKMVSSSISTPTGHHVDEITKILESGLEDPKQLERMVKEFINRNGLNGAELIESYEVKEIQKTISTRLSKKQREELKKVAVNISKICKCLKTRPFLQVMSGSSAKATSEPDIERSFNVYRITPSQDAWNLHCERYNWNWEDKVFDDIPFNQTQPFPRKFNA